MRDISIQFQCRFLLKYVREDWVTCNKRRRFCHLNWWEIRWLSCIFSWKCLKLNLPWREIGKQWDINNRALVVAAAQVIIDLILTIHFLGPQWCRLPAGQSFHPISNKNWPKSRLTPFVIIKPSWALGESGMPLKNETPCKSRQREKKPSKHCSTYSHGEQRFFCHPLA